MILDSIVKSLLLIMQLTEFLGFRHLCFLVDDNEEFADSNRQLLKAFPNNFAKFVTCQE
jgi:hypothetical protein